MSVFAQNRDRTSGRERALYSCIMWNTHVHIYRARREKESPWPFDKKMSCPSNESKIKYASQSSRHRSINER